MSRYPSTVSTEDNPAGLRIHLLGSPEVEWAGESLTVRRRQVRALLYHLAAQLQPIPRDKLCFLFWPDKPESKARRNFRRLLSSLRRELPAPDIILTPGDRVALDSQLVWSDTTAFQDLRASAEPPYRIDTLRQAVDLYRGTFLAGFSLSSSAEYEAWVSQARYVWERRYLETLIELVEIEMEHGEYEHAISHARQYLAVDELAEEVHRQLIELYAAVGDRSAALEQYERCAVVLERELGVDPLPETQTAYQAVREGKAVQRAVPDTEPTWTTLPGLEVPLVGREEALCQLEAAFTTARSGQGGVVLISGEAGIGKSRLMEEFASRREQEALVLTGAGYPDTGTMPYLLVLEALRSIVDLQEAAAQLEPAWLTEAARLLPELRSLVPDIPSHTELEPDEARRWLFEALSRLTLALSNGTQPVLLCLDDLHWADPTTLDWLAYLGRQLRGSRLLILGACRTEGERITLGTS